MRPALLFVAALLLTGSSALAQSTWQPSSPPLVTAENETWFQAGSPIELNGDVYHPAGARQFFNRYQMVRSGSFRGIPLYTDTTLEPDSIVFVPLAGSSMQPYERLRTGPLAGTVGSIAPSLPTQTSAENAPNAAADALIEAPAPPTFARGYDLSAEPAVESPVATSGRTIPLPAATTGRLTYRPGGVVETVAKPSGLNGTWIEFQGRRWVGSGRARDFDPALFERVGTYREYPVYRLKGDEATIYVPIISGRVAPYSVR